MSDNWKVSGDDKSFKLLNQIDEIQLVKEFKNIAESSGIERDLKDGFTFNKSERFWIGDILNKTVEDDYGSLRWLGICKSQMEEIIFRREYKDYYHMWE